MSENKPYAMKWLPPGPKHTRQAIAEMKFEYQVGASLDHPAVIHTYEFKSTSNGSYVLMELFKVLNMKQQIVAGYRNLHHLTKEILQEAAAGITHLHEQGWVHRDIKPDNFLLSDKGQVKLIDFNLCLKPAGVLGKLFGSKTKVQGTHSYMAPEQIRGKGVDPRSDIYSFGCVTHELLTGKPPFTANSPSELLQKHLRAKPTDLRVLDENITPEFAAYVKRMMAKEMNDRPSSMKEVMMEIRTQKIFYNRPSPPAVEEEDGKDKMES